MLRQRFSLTSILFILLLCCSVVLASCGSSDVPSRASLSPSPEGTSAIVATFTPFAKSDVRATATALFNLFGKPVNMTDKKNLTITIANSPSDAVCAPACFDRRNVAVKVGTTITWVNRSSTPHTVTASKGIDAAGLPIIDAQLFDSGMDSLLQTGDTFAYTVTVAAYNSSPTHELVYYCQIHPGMTAMLTIVP